MTEYVLGPDEDQTVVAQRLLAAAKNPGAIQWSPRPNTHPHGGVYVLPDDDAESIIAAVAAQRDAEAKRIEGALAAADERDAKADETGLTPEQLGFAASIGADPGAPGTEGGETQAATDAPAETDAEKAEDAADEATVDDPGTPQDEHAEAQDRVSRRKAARAKATADATVPADQQKSE